MEAEALQQLLTVNQQILEEMRRQAVRDKEYMTLDDIAEEFDYTRKYVNNYIITAPSFPRPCHFAVGKDGGGKSRPYWRRKDVYKALIQT